MTRSRLLTFPVALLALITAAAGWMSAAVSQSAASTGNATAARDIPDNQVFLTFRDTAAGYSIAFPEGWLQHGTGPDVTFQDKDNQLHVVIGSGSQFSSASVKADLASLKSATASLRATSPTALVLPSGAAFKVSYSTVSAPNPVTGKRVTLVVDRYYLSKAGKRAIVELAAPKGADNVDAYRLIIKSFRWR